MSVDPVRQARELHDSHRGMWLVMWSGWKSEFVAFPCWPGAGGGMVVARTPAELERRMGLVATHEAKPGLSPYVGGGRSASDVLGSTRETQRRT